MCQAFLYFYFITVEASCEYDKIVESQTVRSTLKGIEWNQKQTFYYR